jgi:integrase
MALVTERIWRSGPRKIKRAAWGYTVQLDGKQARCFREDWTKEDAERALAARLLGVTPDGALAPVAGMTFGVMVEKFLTEKRSEGKRSIEDDEERSRPLLAFLGTETPLAAITTRRVAEYRVARLATTSRRKTKLSPATVNRECALLRSILRMALAWDELSKLPVFKMAKEEGKERFLAIEEITRLLDACGQSKNKQLLPMVVTDLHTGLRKGELLGLRWEQIDFSRGIIALGRRTKSGKGRDVPLNQAVYDVLAPLRSDAGGLDATGLVWGTITKIDTAYNTALVRAKILDPDVNFHTLRHTFASHYVMRGGSIVKLQAILGHASVRTTQIYARLAPDHLIGATSILEGLGTTKTAQINAPSTHGVSTERPALASGV